MPITIDATASLISNPAGLKAKNVIILKVKKNRNSTTNKLIDHRIVFGIFNRLSMGLQT